MTELSSVRDSVQRFGRRLKTRLIQAVIPAHLRRAIFHCTLAARLAESSHPDHKKLAQAMCRQLDLVCAYNAMLAPMSWSDSIWHDLPTIDLNDQCKGNDLLKWCKTILQKAPEGLLYGTTRAIYEDIANTLIAVGRAKEKSFISDSTAVV